jgi:membrane protease YdiL (CAAX protease family)
LRFLLALPLLPLVEAIVAIVMPLLGVSGMIAGGPLQALILLVMLVPWARWVDRRPLSDYGVTTSWAWVLNLLVGVVVATAVWAGWYALASSLGWVSIEMSMTAPQDSFAFGLVGTFVSLLVNTWVQDVVFFAVVLAGAAEGLRSRGVDSTRAVLGGWIAGVVFFTAIHGTPTLLDFAGTAFGGAVFGLLYVNTGSLALTIGFHAGGSYVVTSIFTPEGMAGAFPSVFEVTKAMPDEGAVVGRIGPYLVTYLVLLGWIWVYHGEVGIETEIAEWNERE